MALPFFWNHTLLFRLSWKLALLPLSKYPRSCLLLHFVESPYEGLKLREREKKENQKKIYFVKMNNFPTELLITVEEMRKSFIKHWWKSVYSLQTVLLFLFLLMKYFYQQSTLSAMLRVLRRDFQKQSLGNIL